MSCPRSARALALLAGACAAGESLAQDARFRVDHLALRDPHAFVDILGCRDVTDAGFGGFSLNGEIQQELDGDEDGDGFLDVSYLLEFLPLARLQPVNFLTGGLASCTAPKASTVCGPMQLPLFAGDAVLRAEDACLAPIAGTVRPYVPAVPTTGPACFAGPEATISVMLAGIPVTLRDARFAARFTDADSTALADGLMMVSSPRPMRTTRSCRRRCP